MSQDTSPSNDMLHMYQDWFRAPQNFMPTQRLSETFSAAAQGFMDAQLAYAQAMMSLNAKMLEAVFDRSAAAADQHAVVKKAA